MNRYVNVKVNISEGQKQKLQSALQVGGPVSIRLGHEDLSGEDVLALTNSQVNKITKAYEGGKGITIKMSKSQLAHNKKVEGRYARQFGCEGTANASKDSSPGSRCGCSNGSRQLRSTKGDGTRPVS